jgi:hypothetical protein
MDSSPTIPGRNKYDVLHGGIHIRRVLKNICLLMDPYYRYFLFFTIMNNSIAARSIIGDRVGLGAVQICLSTIIYCE